METRALNARIAGRVQGVGFRYSTQRKAERLHLKGWVKNLPDGRVEVFAEGPEDVLKQFIDWLHIGPPGSRVISIDISWQFPLETYRSFHIEF